MSENKFSYVLEDALFPIDVSGKYYHELKKVFIAMISDSATPEEIVKKMSAISEGKVTNVQEHLLHLVYVMIMEIENKAVELGKVEDRSLDSNLTSPEN